MTEKTWENTDTLRRNFRGEELVDVEEPEEDFDDSDFAIDFDEVSDDEF